MKVTIHQPHYLPWLGYLAKWAEADLLVFLDSVQYQKQGWQNRNRIKTTHGPRWLSVPVHARLGMPIHEVAIDRRQPWGARHLRAIEHAYAGARWLDRYRPALGELYAQDWDRLTRLAVASAEWLARSMGIATPVLLASELGVKATDPTERLVAVCQAVGADHYLSGPDGARYLDLGRFAAAGVAVSAQRYAHPVYAQLHGEFAPFLSGLDLLLTHGDDSLGILRGGNAWQRLSP